MNHTLLLRGSEPLARDTRTVFELLAGVRGGLLEVRLPDGGAALFGDGESPLIWQVHDEAAFGRILARGDIGLAETYLDGLWDTPDLTALLALLASNREALKKGIYGSWRGLIAARVRHWLNRNSRSGSRRNIMAHYDLGNDFYARWLDPSMSYSSALYREADDGSLETAQWAKYRRILQRLHARPGQRVLEIGCGWGGFAEMAHAEDLHVTGLTLSPAQLAWAQARVPAADLRLQDYRDLQGQFDHVVSIEMFEAVGERYWPGYFSSVAKALKPGGKAVIQSITIDEGLFGQYRKGTDFIQQFIFPGGMLPSRTAFRQAAWQQGLSVQNEYAFGLDYARTLGEWRKAFETNWAAIAPLGFDETFRRLWRLYLCYCEAGFRVGNIDVVQFELVHR